MKSRPSQLSSIVALGLSLMLPFAAACNSSEATQPQTPPPARTTGGSDGGGGGTLPADPVWPYQVRDVLETAKRDLRMYLNSRQEFHKRLGLDMDINRKLFDGQRTIFDVLEETDIEVRMNGPCYDAHGEEKDGSIYASRPKTICLSAARVAPKVVKERVHVETLGLILHELSHLVGTTEDEAKALQQIAVVGMQGIDGRTTQMLIGTYLDAMTRASGSIDRLRKDLRAVSPVQLGDRLFETKQALSDARRAAVADWHYLPVDHQALEHLDYQEAVLDLASSWAITQTDQTDDTNDAPKYDDYFGGQDSLTYSQYKAKRWQSNQDPSPFDGERIARISSIEDLEKILLEASIAISRESDHAHRMRFSSPLFKWNRLPSAGLNQDWRQFAGRFTVKSVECKGSWAEKWRSGLKAVEIYEYDQPSSTRSPMIKYVTADGYSHDVLAFDAYNVNVWGISLEGGKGWFTFKEGRGDLWESRQLHGTNSVTTSFKETVSGVTLTQVWGATNKRYDTNGDLSMSSSEESCSYELVRD